MPKYWLMKTEPDVFSFDDLVACPGKTDSWDGVRNYQARNMMRDDFKKGDKVFIYHSRVKPPCIAGVAEVVKEGYPDDTALDESCPYFDPKSAEKGESRWVMVDVKAKEKFQTPVPLTVIRETSGLEKMPLIQKGQRLSIQPVSEKEWKILYSMGSPKKV